MPVKTRTTRKPRKKTDRFERNFGPGPDSPAPGARTASTEARSSGPFPGLACAGEGCLFKPAAGLVARFSLRLARGHESTLFHAATSGIEFMKALRDFLDEEIALVERASGVGGTGGTTSSYERIKVD